MNLIDAIKSGRPIRRRMPHEAMRNPNTWVDPQYMLEHLRRGDMRPLSTEDFFADDWETKEISVTITPSQFWAAYYTVIKADINNYMYPTSGLMPALAKELGLGDPK